MALVALRKHFLVTSKNFAALSNLQRATLRMLNVNKNSAKVSKRQSADLLRWRWRRRRRRAATSLLTCVADVKFSAEFEEDYALTTEREGDGDGVAVCRANVRPLILYKCRHRLLIFWPGQKVFVYTLTHTHTHMVNGVVNWPLLEHKRQPWILL